jgi:hypothetical protein
MNKNNYFLSADFQANPTDIIILDGLYQITESQAFALVFVRKTAEFLTAKHWLR